MAKLNLKVQFILSELYNLYQSEGTFGRYHTLYNFLESEGRDFKQSKELKEQLWIKAKKRFNRERQNIIKSDLISNEDKKKELNNYYKTELVAEYLLRVKRETGMTLDINDENGNKLSLLTPKPFEK